MQTAVDGFARDVVVAAAATATDGDDVHRAMTTRHQWPIVEAGVTDTSVQWRSRGLHVGILPPVILESRPTLYNQVKTLLP